MSGVTEGSGLQWTGQPEPHCIKHKVAKLLLISKRERERKTE